MSDLKTQLSVEGSSICFGIGNIWLEFRWNQVPFSRGDGTRGTTLAYGRQKITFLSEFLEQEKKIK